MILKRAYDEQAVRTEVDNDDSHRVGKRREANHSRLTKQMLTSSDGEREEVAPRGMALANEVKAKLAAMPRTMQSTETQWTRTRMTAQMTRLTK